MNRYARETSVSPERSRVEIEQLLRRYGADEFVNGWSGNEAMIGFRLRQRLVRFLLKLPDRKEEEFLYTPHRRSPRSTDDAMRAWEQAVRQRWRALVLCIKAKLEAVESGVETFEQAFAVHMVLPDGSTVAQWLVPQLDEVYRTKTMPALLPFRRPDESTG